MQMLNEIKSSEKNFFFRFSFLSKKNKTSRLFFQAMEKCVEDGLVRDIGLSNFNSEQVQNIVENCKIKPATNQVPAVHLLCWTFRSREARTLSPAPTQYTTPGPHC